MTALDDRPVSRSIDMLSAQTPRFAPSVVGDRRLSDARWDSLIRTMGAEPVWFRFTDTNPLTGRSYARSRWADLPYMIGVLARRFVLTTAEWDALALTGQALHVVGDTPWRVPFTMTPPLGLPSPPVGDPPGMCGDCGGTGLSVDDDVSMTGTRDAVFLCWCSGEPV